MLNSIKTFASDESGAVTVDWVVLTAALVGLGLAVMGVISGGLQTLSQNIDNCLTAAVGTTGSNGTATAVAESGTGAFAVGGC